MKRALLLLLIAGVCVALIRMHKEGQFLLIPKTDCYYYLQIAKGGMVVRARCLGSQPMSAIKNASQILKKA